MNELYKQAGFCFEGPEDLIKFLDLVSDQLVATRTPHDGWYKTYTSEHDAQIFAQHDPNDNLIGAHPHVSGPGRMRVKVVTVKLDRSHPLDGRIVVELLDDEPGTPLTVESPEFWLSALAFKPGNEVVMQIAAFSAGASIYPTEEEFNKSPLAGFRPDGALIPSGMFKPQSQGGGPIDPPLPRAILWGRLKSAELCTHSNGGSSFWKCELMTLGGGVTAVFDAEEISTPPGPGHIVAGTFSLMGVLEDDYKYAQR